MRKNEITINLEGTWFTVFLSSLLCETQYSWYTDRHCNAGYELHIILSGKCIVNVENHLYEIPANNAILVAPGQYHKPQSVSNDFRRLSLSFTISPGSLATEIIQQIMPCKIIAIPSGFPQICSQVFYEVSHTSLFQYQMLSSLSEQLLIAILRCLKISSTKPKDVTPVDWRTGIIDDYFEKRVSQYGTERELADLLHLSCRQLSRVLQTNYGVNFRQKLLHARMEHAGWLLRTTDRSVTEICSVVGYTSEAMFYKNFKNYYNMTPLQYRKSKIR